MSIQLGESGSFSNESDKHNGRIYVLSGVSSKLNSKPRIVAAIKEQHRQTNTYSS